MTHSYQFCENLPHTRKKLNAAFVHRIKKLCGRVYRLHVVETFADESFGDFITIERIGDATDGSCGTLNMGDVVVIAIDGKCTFILNIA